MYILYDTIPYYIKLYYNSNHIIPYIIIYSTIILYNILCRDGEHLDCAEHPGAGQRRLGVPVAVGEEQGLPSSSSMISIRIVSIWLKNSVCLVVV